MGWFSTESSYLTSASPQARLPVITEVVWPLKAVVNCTGSGIILAGCLRDSKHDQNTSLAPQSCSAAQAASCFGMEPVLWIWISVVVPYCRTLLSRLHARSLKTGWDMTICTTVSGVRVHFLETPCFLSIKLEKSTKWIVFLVCHNKKVQGSQT